MTNVRGFVLKAFISAKNGSSFRTVVFCHRVTEDNANCCVVPYATILSVRESSKGVVNESTLPKLHEMIAFETNVQGNIQDPPAEVAFTDSD